jgi:inosine-uridine nucleoside N-ribohydrolase
MKEVIFEKAFVPPIECVDAVIDTDTYNEIDDQFALSYMIRSSDKINLKAIYAAPFFNQNSTSPADGMERSYNEIFNILTLMGEDDLKKCVYRGSTSYLPDEKTPIVSDAAEHLASLAMSYSSEKPLYVVAIGAITNVASALLLKPEIAEKIVLVWLGGHSFDWPNTKEFNMYQDVAGARVIFDSKAPVIQLPCNGVVSAFRVSGDDMRARLFGKNELCTYLTTHSEEEVSRYVKPGDAWSRVIWDITAVAWITGGNKNGNAFMDYRITSTPICEYDFTYSFDNTRHKMVYVYNIKRDQLFNDMIKKLTK